MTTRRKTIYWVIGIVIACNIFWISFTLFGTGSGSVVGP
jgi:predicted branched-subunit amino acid permease